MSENLSFSYFGFDLAKVKDWFLGQKNIDTFIFVSPAGFSQDFVEKAFAIAFPEEEKKCRFEFSSVDPLVTFQSKNTRYIQLRLLDGVDISMALDRLRAFGIEIFKDEALFLFQKSAGVPAVVRKYLNARLQGNITELNRIEKTRLFAREFVSDLEQNLGDNWEAFCRAIRAEISPRLELFFYEKSKLGLSFFDFKILKKEFNDLFPSLGELTDADLSRGAYPFAFKKLEPAEALETSILAGARSLSLTDIEKGLEGIFRLGKFRLILDYCALLEHLNLNKSAFVVWLQATCHGLLGEVSQEKMALEKETDSLSFFSKKIIVEKIRLLFSTHSFTDQIEIIEKEQSKVDKTDWLYWMLECERARVARLINPEDAIRIVSNVERYLSSNHTDFEKKEIKGRLLFVKGILEFFKKEFLNSTDFLLESLKFYIETLDLKAFLHVAQNHLLSLYNLGQMSEFNERLRFFFESYGEVKLAYIKCGFEQLLVLKSLGEGNFLAFSFSQRDFYQKWQAIERVHIDQWTNNLFNTYILASIFSNETETAYSILRKTLDRNMLAAYPSELFLSQWRVALIEGFLSFSSRTRVKSIAGVVKSNWSHLENNVSDLIELLELNSQNAFEFRLEENIISLLTVKDLSNAPAAMPYLAQLFGTNLAVEGRLGLARQELEKALTLADKWEFDFFKARASVGLALVQVAELDFDRAISSLETAASLVTESFPKKEEFLWIPVLLGLARFKKGEFEKSEAAFLSVDPNSHVMAFVDIISVGIGRARPKVFGCPDRFYKLYERLFNVILPEMNRKIEVRSSLGKKFYYPHELPSFNSKHYAIVFDELKNELWVWGRRVSLAKASVQSEMFKYLFQNIGLEISKHDLTIRLWKESYNPSIHDPRIYMAVLRLRKLLLTGSYGRGVERNETVARKVEALITATRNGYRLYTHENWVWISKEKSHSEFNEKQQWILGYLDTNSTVSRQLVQKTLKIGSTTAKKEIQELVNKGLIKRVGSARATEYSKRN